jgi:hypothetical protein
VIFARRLQLTQSIVTTYSSADSDSTPKGDYERAEESIFQAMGQVEARLQKAVEEEVHAIFDADLDHAERTKVAEHAKIAVQKGARKVKAKPHEYYKAQKDDGKHDDHKILHAIEAAEKAVLHAVQEEVETLFHETQDAQHPLKDDHPKTAKKAKQGVTKGVQKAKKHVEASHEVRQGWMLDEDSHAIEEYMKSATGMYGNGL